MHVHDGERVAVQEQGPGRRHFLRPARRLQGNDGGNANKEGRSGSRQKMHPPERSLPGHAKGRSRGRDVRVQHEHGALQEPQGHAEGKAGHVHARGDPPERREAEVVPLRAARCEEEFHGLPQEQIVGRRQMLQPLRRVREVREDLHRRKTMWLRLRQHSGRRSRGILVHELRQVQRVGDGKWAPRSREHQGEGNEKLRKNVLRPQEAGEKEDGRAKKEAGENDRAKKEAGEEERAQKEKYPRIMLRGQGQPFAPAGFKPMLAESLGTVRDGKLVKKKKIDVRGYYASEKFDGYRAIWDGEKFISREGTRSKCRRGSRT